MRPSNGHRRRALPWESAAAARERRRAPDLSRDGPGAGWRLVDGAVKKIVVVRTPGGFGKDVEAMRVLFGRGVGDACEFSLGLPMMSAAIEGVGQSEFRVGASFWRSVDREFAILSDGVVPALALHQQVGASVALGPGRLKRNGQPFEFVASGVGFCRHRHHVVDVSERLGRFRILFQGSVGASQSKFDFRAGGQAIFLENLGGLGGAPIADERGGVAEMRVADEQRVRIGRREIRQRGQTFRLTSHLQITGSEIVGNVVAEISGEGLGAVQRLDRLRAFVIDDVGVSDHEPGERSGVFFRVSARVGFDSGVGSGRTVLDQLLRHATQTGRGNKRLTDPTHARRHRTATTARASVRGCLLNWFFGRSFMLRRLRRGAGRGRLRCGRRILRMNAGVEVQAACEPEESGQSSNRPPLETQSRHLNNFSRGDANART